MFPASFKPTQWTTQNICSWLSLLFVSPRPRTYVLGSSFSCRAPTRNICSWLLLPAREAPRPSSRTQLAQLIRSFFQLAAVCQIFDGGKTPVMRETVASQMFASLQHFKILTLQRFKVWTMRGGHNLFIKHLFTLHMAGRTFVHTIYRLIMNSVLTGCMVLPCEEFING